MNKTYLNTLVEAEQQQQQQQQKLKTLGETVPASAHLHQVSKSYLGCRFQCQGTFFFARVETPCVRCAQVICFNAKEPFR